MRKACHPLWKGLPNIKEWTNLSIYTGSIKIYRSVDLDNAVNIPEANDLVYVQMRTIGSIFKTVNEGSVSQATLRLEVEMRRTAEEFYNVAKGVQHDEAALDLILLMGKGTDLSSR